MRLSEIYTSIQGEGPGVGSPTQFVRFAGCNLKCPGWPCDTPHAIDPKQYRGEWSLMTPGEVYESIHAYPRAVTFTGGEPFIQPEDELEELYVALDQAGYTIEIFTNGTRPFPLWSRVPEVHIIMDWKLNDSGEDSYNDTRWGNASNLRNKDAIKFVCASHRDFVQALKIYDTLGSVLDEDDPPQFYMGAAWGKVKEADLAEWMMNAELPSFWKMNVQVHNYIWPRDERRR